MRATKGSPRRFTEILNTHLTMCRYFFLSDSRGLCRYGSQGRYGRVLRISWFFLWRIAMPASKANKAENVIETTPSEVIHKNGVVYHRKKPRPQASLMTRKIERAGLESFDTARPNQECIFGSCRKLQEYRKNIRPIFVF